MSQTQFSSSVPRRRRRRTSTVRLAGLSIITYVHSALGGSGRRKHKKHVLMHALLTTDASLSTGVTARAAGYMLSIVNVNRLASRSLKSSDDVSLSPVRDASKCLWLFQLLKIIHVGDTLNLICIPRSCLTMIYCCLALCILPVIALLFHCI